MATLKDQNLSANALPGMTSRSPTQLESGRSRVSAIIIFQQTGSVSRNQWPTDEQKYALVSSKTPS